MFLNKSKTIWLFALLVFILIISLGMKPIIQIKESMINMDEQYLNILPMPQDASKNFYLPPGHYYIDASLNTMAKIPPEYIITPDKTGIVTTNPSDIIQIKLNNKGVIDIPNGYYQVAPFSMAIIPNGFKKNNLRTGITLKPDIINRSPDITSPTSRTKDASYNALIKYNSDNFDTNYHEDLSFNPQLSRLSLNPTYYEPGAFKYGGSTYVPNYEDSVYLSKTTYKSTVTTINPPDKPVNICLEYKYYPSRLENACNNLDKKSCKSSNCCVLIGGEKCVSGDSQGPTFKYNYSDFLIKNRDYYYYNNKCYGNCPYYESTGCDTEDN